MGYVKKNHIINFGLDDEDFNLLIEARRRLGAKTHAEAFRLMLRSFTRENVDISSHRELLNEIAAVKKILTDIQMEV